MSKHRGSNSCPDLCVLRKLRLRCIQKSSVFATHPSKSFKPHLEGEISVHIAICKSISQNLRDEMSCCTIPSRLPCLFYDTEFSHSSSGVVSHGGKRAPSRLLLTLVKYGKKLS